jgi:hypothetical protein
VEINPKTRRPHCVHMSKLRGQLGQVKGDVSAYSKSAKKRA